MSHISPLRSQMQVSVYQSYFHFYLMQLDVSLQCIKMVQHNEGKGK